MMHNESQIEAARKIYDLFWNSNLTGDVDTFASTLDDNFEMIGTSESELCNTAKVQISISDNAPGIPDSIKDKIFQPFFTTKPTGKGTGLGLSLSYDIVKAHGGEIRVESHEGRGTEFIIQLPV